MIDRRRKNTRVFTLEERRARSQKSSELVAKRRANGEDVDIHLHSNYGENVNTWKGSYEEVTQ